MEIRQAKAERTFSPANIREAANKFSTAEIATGETRTFGGSSCCRLCPQEPQGRRRSDLQTEQFAERGATFSLWNSLVIYGHLPGDNFAVRTNLRQDWHESIFGKPTDPLTGLLQDLECGWNPSVLSLQAFVTRLDQAESARSGRCA
ncbi:hypothetical protein [Sphingomonas quercus]|uniref:Uncharacterized protein n=1 Tax=Sphingomonas quercus TaxID=2842451 RepID=A0ABS6BG95_9SPHN|nr:hypothetical protein [Sphingomonas quercus]MBU3077309.1 hypothetical protein [Sphingomonas quercus]